MSKSFTLFPELPSEIRLLIWGLSLTARVITMKCELSGFSPQDAPEFRYLFGGDPPYTHFTVGVVPHPNEPYYMGHLYPFRVTSPAAMSVCHESRDVALRAGYKRWNVRHPVWGSRKIVWNDSWDVLLFEKHPLLSEDTILDLFVEQFPGMTRKVERIAMSSSLWPFWNRANINPVNNILDFKALRELVVVVDQKMEKDCSKQIRDLRSGRNSEEDAWVVPEAVIDSFEGIRRSYLLSGSRKRLLAETWTSPEVRGVSSQSQILTEDSEDLKLRCFPCECLDRVSTTSLLSSLSITNWSP